MTTENFQLPTMSKGSDLLVAALENEGGFTQFILAVNDLRRIAFPVQSRCTVLEFRPLEDEALHAVLHDALRKTHFELSEATIDAIVARSRGIPREALKLLLEEGAGGDPRPPIG